MIPPPVDRIVLVGFMGTGKSTVGRALASRLGWTFLDIDTMVADDVGLTVAEIFRLHGEAFFRDREHAAMLDQLTRVQAVIATGGGWPTLPGRMRSLPPGTVSVWLDVPVSVLTERLTGGPRTRPLLEVADPEARVRELAEAREPFYRLADMTVDGTLPPYVIAEQILHGLGRGAARPDLEP